MNRYAFYPGCALQSMSWDYRESLKEVTVALGLDLQELEDWTCCGATAAHSLDEKMSVMLPARNLASAEALGRDLVVACPMCFKRLKISRHMLEEKQVDVPWSIAPDLKVWDLARLLASESWLDRVAEMVSVDLSGLRVVCYYGCQVVRSPRITGYEDYENPQHLDRLVSAVGATSIDWSFKATCCGASVGIPRRDIGLALVERLLRGARKSGAQAIVVCCPLCQGNLDLLGAELARRSSVPGGSPAIPILYYTELLAVAFGLASVRKGLKSHLVDPAPLLDGLSSLHPATSTHRADSGEGVDHA
ncbi:MAG: disulfide reductase [Syntrophobacteraceae bacterium]|nr:disulfide reductase [Syntrophobacteraceae bacterium]